MNEPYLELVKQAKQLIEADKDEEIRRRWDEIEDVARKLKHQTNRKDDLSKYDPLSYVVMLIVRFIETQETSFLRLSLIWNTHRRLFRVMVGLDNSIYTDNPLMMTSAKLLHKNILLLKELSGLIVTPDWHERMLKEGQKYYDKREAEEAPIYREYIAEL